MMFLVLGKQTLKHAEGDMEVDKDFYHHRNVNNNIRLRVSSKDTGPGFGIEAHCLSGELQTLCCLHYTKMCTGSFPFHSSYLSDYFQLKLESPNHTPQNEVSFTSFVPDVVEEKRVNVAAFSPSKSLVTACPCVIILKDIER